MSEERWNTIVALVAFVVVVGGLGAIAYVNQEVFPFFKEGIENIESQQ